MDKQKENDGAGLTHLPKMESRILNYFNHVSDTELENIFFENFSFLDKGLKNKIKYGTDIYLFSNQNKKTVYIVYDCAKMGEFSASVANSICDHGLENTGITEEHLIALDVTKWLIGQYSRNNQIDEVIFIGYSYGGNKALYIYLSDGDKKNKCILINSLFLTEKSIDHLKKTNAITNDKFETLTEKILNVNSVDDPISYANENPFGKIIYFPSGNNKGCDGHDITNMDLSKTAKESSNSWVQAFFSIFLNDPQKSYDKTKKTLECFEKFSGTETNINGTQLEYSFTGISNGFWNLIKLSAKTTFTKIYGQVRTNLADKIIRVPETQNQKNSLLNKVNRLKEQIKSSSLSEPINNSLLNEI